MSCVFRGSLLKPNEKSQTDMLSGGLAEILCRVAEGGEAVFCIPGPNNCFEPAAHYGIDGVTEKVIYFYIKYEIFLEIEIFHFQLRLFKTKKEDELKKLLGRYFSTVSEIREKKIIFVRSGIRTHAHRSGLRPERSALDHSAILTL